MNFNKLNILCFTTSINKYKEKMSFEPKIQQEKIYKKNIGIFNKIDISIKFVFTTFTKSLI